MGLEVGWATWALVHVMQYSWIVSRDKSLRSIKGVEAFSKVGHPKENT